MQYRKDKYGNPLSVLGYGCMRFPRKQGHIDMQTTEAQLLQAIEDECEAGRMAQNYNFRTNPDSNNTYWINFDMGELSEQISCYTDCTYINEFLIGLGIEHRYLREDADMTVEH